MTQPDPTPAPRPSTPDLQAATEEGVMSIHTHGVGALAVLMIVALVGVLSSVLGHVDDDLARCDSRDGPVALATLY